VPIIIKRHIILIYSFQLNTLKGATKALAGDIMRPDTLRSIKTTFLTPKGMASTPVLFLWEFPPPPRISSCTEMSDGDGEGGGGGVIKPQRHQELSTGV